MRLRCMWFGFKAWMWESGRSSWFDHASQEFVRSAWWHLGPITLKVERVTSRYEAEQ